jgi:hypothetical protein
MDTIKFTATQKQNLDNMQELSSQEFKESIGKVKACDFFISLNRPSRFKMFISSIKSFFKRLFGIKDNTGKIYVTKNRKGHTSGNLNFTIDYKQQTITKNIFMEEKFEDYLKRLKDRRTEDGYKYTDEDFEKYIDYIKDCYTANLSVYKCLEFMYFETIK